MLKVSFTSTQSVTVATALPPETAAATMFETTFTEPSLSSVAFAPFSCFVTNPIERVLSALTSDSAALDIAFSSAKTKSAIVIVQPAD